MGYYIIILFFLMMLMWVLSDRKYIGGLKEFIDLLLGICCLFVSITYNFGNAIIILCLFMVIFYFYRLNESGEKYG